MSKHLTPSPNLRCLKNLSKRLLKLWMNFDPEAISQLRRLHPSFERMTDEQLVSKMNLHNAQISMTREYGFQNWRDICGAIEAMKLANLSKLTGDQISSMLVAAGSARGAGTDLSRGSRSERLAKYEQGRPYRENGALYISKKHGLTLEEALNDTARIHDMPPIGTRYQNSYGLEWAVENYAYFVAPTTMARYPGDCDYLPVVYPQNPSMLLQSFIAEVDHCTTRWILLLDTMPAVHPLGLGNQIHCSHLSGDPTEAHIFLDVKHAHETIIAHELAHLWFSFVEDGDGGRVLRDCRDFGKKNQLDFIQSFVLDLRVNDLIDKRGFDMSLIAEDQIRGLEALRDLMMTSFVPPTRREPLMYALQIAGAVMERKRWPANKKGQLPRLLEFFEAAIPEIYATAMELVGIVKRTGVASKTAARKAMDECVSLGFRFTGDEIDLERDLEEMNLTECMQDKYPDELQGAPVQLKLETYRAQARLALIEEDNVASYTQSPEGAVDLSRKYEMGPARPTQSRHTHEPTPLSSAHMLPPAPGDPIRYPRGIFGKHPVKADPSALFRRIPIVERPFLRGVIPDNHGRVPGDNGYNTSYPLGEDPFSQMQR